MAVCASLLLIGMHRCVGETETRPVYDIAIVNGRIVDGTGAPWYQADLGIRDGRIVKIGKVDPESASETIDAEGLIVAPGFVDMMGQTAYADVAKITRRRLNLLTQGHHDHQCGGRRSSAAPLPEEPRIGCDRVTRRMAEYFHACRDRKGMPVNVVQTVGTHPDSSES